MLSLKRMWIFLCLALVLAPIDNIFAQGHPSPGDNPEQGESREKIRENIETLRMWKLLEALDLTSEQSAQFLPVVQDFQKAKRSFEDKRRELLHDLETALQTSQNEKKLKEILTDFETNRKQFQEESERYLEKAKAILTIQQQAQLFLFEDKFERKMRETIEQIRGRHSGWKEPER
jgi:Spy/CpxP family protein refolding chaperone